MSLPAWLTQKLASPPDAGTGIHAWIFSCARQLHAHGDATWTFNTLMNACAVLPDDRKRGLEREIRQAVNNSLAVAWSPKGERKEWVQGTLRDLPAQPDRWPKADPVARRCRIKGSAKDGVAGIADLWERSPIQAADAWTVDDWLEVMFPGAEWVCLATDHPATARSRQLGKWMFGPAEKCGLVVPSPMTGPSGKGLDGRTSHRCLDNTGPRLWLVIEFDSGTLDEQAALHWHLCRAAVAVDWPTLKLIVHSAGKSLHGFYGPCKDDSITRELMAYAVALGADPATWNRCQLVRLPGGVRKDKRQEVFFFDPTPAALAT